MNTVKKVTTKQILPLTKINIPRHVRNRLEDDWRLKPSKMPLIWTPWSLVSEILHFISNRFGFLLLLSFMIRFFVIFWKKAKRRHKTKENKTTDVLYKIYRNAYKHTAETHSMRIPKKNQRTHLSWQRVVKCSPVIYFVFINLLIYFACCQSLIFVSLRWTSSCYFWPLCINVKSPNNGFEYGFCLECISSAFCCISLRSMSKNTDISLHWCQTHAWKKIKYFENHIFRSLRVLSSHPTCER